ncbi:MAG: hypothetical protein ACLFUC_00970 [Bacteroidales bacterium]
MQIAKNRNVRFGIVEYPAPLAIKDDKDLENYIAELSKYLVYIGLQPIEPGWSSIPGYKENISGDNKSCAFPHICLTFAFV